jgi:Ni/Co efflux regulator RcnB
MNKKTIVSAIMAMCLTTGGAVFAQGKGDRDDRGRNDHGQRGQQDRRDHDGRQQDRHDQGRAHFDNHRGAGPNYQFHTGDRMPAEYRHRQYVVNDWRSHQLSAPPRGYQWVQSGSDYVLVAIATGIILQLFLN